MREEHGNLLLFGLVGAFRQWSPVPYIATVVHQGSLGVVALDSRGYLCTLGRRPLGSVKPCDPNNWRGVVTPVSEFALTYYLAGFYNVEYARVVFFTPLTLLTHAAITRGDGGEILDHDFLECMGDRVYSNAAKAEVVEKLLRGLKGEEIGRVLGCIAKILGKHMEGSLQSFADGQDIEFMRRVSEALVKAPDNARGARVEFTLSASAAGRSLKLDIVFVPVPGVITESHRLAGEEKPLIVSYVLEEQEALEAVTNWMALQIYGELLKLGERRNMIVYDTTHGINYLSIALREAFDKALTIYLWRFKSKDEAEKRIQLIAGYNTDPVTGRPDPQQLLGSRVGIRYHLIDYRRGVSEEWVASIKSVYRVYMENTPYTPDQLVSQVVRSLRDLDLGLQEGDAKGINVLDYALGILLKCNIPLLALCVYSSARSVAVRVREGLEKLPPERLESMLNAVVGGDGMVYRILFKVGKSRFDTAAAILMQLLTLAGVATLLENLAETLAAIGVRVEADTTGEGDKGGEGKSGRCVITVDPEAHRNIPEYLGILAGEATRVILSKELEELEKTTIGTLAKPGREEAVLRHIVAHAGISRDTIEALCVEKKRDTKKLDKRRHIRIHINTDNIKKLLQECRTRSNPH